jgi:hypothetical protein
MVRSALPVRALQTFTVQSLLPLTSRELSGVNATLVTSAVCPSRESTSLPVRVLQTFTVLSLLPLRMRSPSALTATQFTSSLWPLSVD